MTQTVNITFEESSYLKLNNNNYLYELSNKISNVLNISSPEIIYQDIEEDARYYNELNIISINIKFINNDYEILEIDAYAFMSKCLKEFDNIDYHHPNYIMDELIIRYKNKYLK